VAAHRARRRRAGARRGSLRFVAQDAFFDAGRRLEAMDASGVDAEVVSPMPPLLQYAMPAEDGRRLCRGINEFVARLCEAAPGRLHGLGTVPLQDPDAAAAELSEVRAMGLRGVEIGSNVEARSLGEDRFAGFFQEAERLRLGGLRPRPEPHVRRPPPRPGDGLVRLRHGDRAGRRLARRRRHGGALSGAAPGPEPRSRRVFR